MALPIGAARDGASWLRRPSRRLRHPRLMAKTNLFEFLQQVRTEVSKVTWPTRRETAITTVMVFIMVMLASIFFLFADWVLSYLVRLVLGIGG